MTYFTTSVAPINVYGDTAQVLEIHDWQAGYDQYLNDNNLTLDSRFNPVKKGIDMKNTELVFWWGMGSVVYDNGDFVGPDIKFNPRGFGCLGTFAECRKFGDGCFLTLGNLDFNKG